MTTNNKFKFPRSDSSSAYEIHEFSESLTPSSVSANTVAEEAFTVTGVLADDVLLGMEPKVAINVGIVGARITAADQVTVGFANPTAGALSPTAGAYRFTVLRKASS